VGAVGFGGRNQFGSAGAVRGAGGLGVSPGGGIGRRLARRLLAAEESMGQVVASGRNLLAPYSLSGWHRSCACMLCCIFSMSGLSADHYSE
jgi:hypothetical protein